MLTFYKKLSYVNFLLIGFFNDKIKLLYRHISYYRTLCAAHNLHN